MTPKAARAGARPRRDATRDDTRVRALTTEGLSAAVRNLLVAAVVLLLLAAAQSVAAQTQGEIDQEVLDDIVSDRVAIELARRGSLTGADIAIEVEDQDVTLKGWVGSDRQRQRALRAARRTPGVRSVEDELTVQSALDTSVAAVEDEEVIERAARQLNQEFPAARLEKEWIFGWELDAPNWSFEVEADGGDLRLEGTLAKPGDIRRAVDAVRDIEGVRRVVAKLVVDERSPYGFARSPYGPGALAAGPYDVHPYRPAFGLPYGGAP